MRSLNLIVGQPYWQMAIDIIVAAIELDRLMWTFGVIEDNHVITLVRDCSTSKVYLGFSSRLRRQLRLPEYQDMLTLRLPWTHLRRIALLSDPKTTDEERRVLQRHPGHCAEHDAHNKFYLDRPYALPQESFSVSVKYYNGGYFAVRRCLNCLLYCEAMGNVPTDRIHCRRIPLQPSERHIHSLADAIRRADQENLNRSNGARESRQFYPPQSLDYPGKLLRPPFSRGEGASESPHQGTGSFLQARTANKTNFQPGVFYASNLETESQNRSFEHILNLPFRDSMTQLNDFRTPMLHGRAGNFDRI